MYKKNIITILLALVAMAGQAQKKIAEVKADSLLLFVQAGDSCMRLYNSFEALKYYQKAYAIAKIRSQQLVNHYPMDGEMVAGLTLAYANSSTSPARRRNQQINSRR